MDSNHEKIGNTKLTLAWLRENLASTVGKDLIMQEFSIDKKQTKFKKKVGLKNKIEVYIEGYAYSSKVEFKLVFNFYVSEIEKEREKFYNYCNLKFKKRWTFMFSEGFFHPKTKELDFKYQVAATHVVYDDNTLREGIQDCRKILKENIIPMFPIFSDLDKFQNFILNDYDVITKPGLLESSFLALKLKSKAEVANLVNTLWVKLDMENKSELHTIKIFFRNFLKYITETAPGLPSSL